MAITETPSFTPSSQSEWREWLQENHDKEQSVWLIKYKKRSGIPSINWSDAVDEALCFGWIDSLKKSIDHEKYKQFYCRRKPKGTWSKVNKEKVEKLIADGLMTQAGLDAITIAKQNGSWTILDTVDALIIPVDLEDQFQTRPGSKDHFLSLSKSIKKGILYWVISAKRDETRLKRISEIVECNSAGTVPKQFL